MAAPPAVPATAALPDTPPAVPAAARATAAARRLCPALLVALLLVLLAAGPAACSSGGGEATDTSVTTEVGAAPAGDIDSTVGKAIRIGKVTITVRAVEATFNPVAPDQRMSEQTPSAPNGDESFYQAYVKVSNKGDTPVRVDPEDFACAVGNSVVGIEATWSGPVARSLLKNSSMDLLITFKAKAGYEPVLLYSPSWYDGTIRIKQQSAATTTSTQ
jgi:hypothetical protein